MKSPMRLPSSPRTDMREVLPVPPVARTVIPADFCQNVLYIVNRPCIWFMLITDMAWPASRNLRASLLPITYHLVQRFCFGFQADDDFFSLSLYPP